MSDKSYTDNLNQSESGQKGDLPPSNGTESVPAAESGADGRAAEGTGSCSAAEPGADGRAGKDNGVTGDSRQAEHMTADAGSSGKKEISLIAWGKEPGKNRNASRQTGGRRRPENTGVNSVENTAENAGRRSAKRTAKNTGVNPAENTAKNAAENAEVNSVENTGKRSAKRGGPISPVRERSAADVGNDRPGAAAKRGTGKGKRKSVRSRRRGFRRRLRRFLPVILAGIIAVFLLFLIISGIRAVVRRIIPDKTPPVIQLTRKADYFVDSAEEYEEEGYAASDNRDGDLTDKVTVSVTENTICYRVSDRAGNIAQEYREIPLRKTGNSSGDGTGEPGGRQKGEYISDRKNVVPGSVPDTKVIYLTFDDGPGEYTEHLLDILDHYGVHVTFFVTGAFPYYEDMIKKEYDAGHSIGVHTFSHDFEKIYSSDKAFWEDIEKMEKIVEKQTGRRTSLMRFAGGSSNTMSADYTPGIMTLLAEQAEKKGMHYFDWNVSSGDGAANPIGEEVVNKIITQVQNNDHSVVLCHDTKESTVNNIEYVIAWALENGYTFLPLDENSETAHHAILN